MKTQESHVRLMLDCGYSAERVARRTCLTTEKVNEISRQQIKQSPLPFPYSEYNQWSCPRRMREWNKLLKENS